jgi:hypothetical protein
VAVVAAESSSRDGHSYAPVPSSVRSARELVRETLRLHGLEAGVAQVLVSELAANAVRHARTEFTVGISVGDVVRIEVGDGELTLEGLQIAPDKFGLRLVDAFADRWGVDLVPTGKRVWCELDAGRLAALPVTSSRAARVTESARR